MRGEKGETGNAGPRPGWTGDPSPVIPETLCRLEAPFAGDCKGGRTARLGGSNWSFDRKLRAGSDWWSRDGGVREPVVGAVPLLPSLEVSVEWSALKLALDCLRSFLRLKREGAIVVRTRRTARSSLRVPLRSSNYRVSLPCHQRGQDEDGLSNGKEREGSRREYDWHLARVVRI